MSLIDYDWGGLNDPFLNRIIKSLLDKDKAARAELRTRFKGSGKPHHRLLRAILELEPEEIEDIVSQLPPLIEVPEWRWWHTQLYSKLAQMINSEAQHVLATMDTIQALGPLQARSKNFLAAYYAALRDAEEILAQGAQAKVEEILTETEKE